MPFAASDIRLFQTSTNEDLLAHSREVINSNGEWDLADITVAPISLDLYDASYSEIRYNVRTFYFDKSPIIASLSSGAEPVKEFTAMSCEHSLNLLFKYKI